MAKTFPIEIDNELHKRLKIAAIEEGITLHQWITKTLEEKVCGNGSSVNKSRQRKSGAVARR